MHLSRFYFRAGIRPVVYCALQNSIYDWKKPDKLELALAINYSVPFSWRIPWMGMVLLTLEKQNPQFACYFWNREWGFKQVFGTCVGPYLSIMVWLRSNQIFSIMKNIPINSWRQYMAHDFGAVFMISTPETGWQRSFSIGFNLLLNN